MILYVTQYIYKMEPLYSALYIIVWVQTYYNFRDNFQSEIKDIERTT